jgi:syntaxin 16
MTRKVKQADENINKLSKLSHDSTGEEEVKHNMKINLATKIKDFSRDFQLNEEMYMKKYQELVGDKTNYLQVLDGASNSSYSGQADFLQTTDKDYRFLRQRDEEISTLLTSITELAGVFKDLQTLVSHQGTILDRIDYNIETAGENIKHAHKSLVATEKMMKSNCYRNSMLCIIVSIFVMCILLLFKYTK